jgi:hypothetical protein
MVCFGFYQLHLLHGLPRSLSLSSILSTCSSQSCLCFLYFLSSSLPTFRRKLRKSALENSNLLPYWPQICEADCKIIHSLIAWNYKYWWKITIWSHYLVNRQPCSPNCQLTAMSHKNRNKKIIKIMVLELWYYVVQYLFTNLHCSQKIVLAP